MYSQNIRRLSSNSRRLVLILLSALLLLSKDARAGAPKNTSPPDRLAVLDAIIKDAIHDGEVPGAVLLIGHSGQVVYRKAFGSRSVEPRHEPMTLDTVFDLASLTKVVATTIAVMQLVEKGEIRTNDPVAKYVPEFAQNGKEDITVRQLLTHFSGLREDLDLSSPWQGRDTALQMAYAQQPIYAPGARFLYSDVNFIVLGALVERVQHALVRCTYIYRRARALVVRERIDVDPQLRVAITQQALE